MSLKNKTIDEIVKDKELAIIEKKETMKRADAIVLPLNVGKLEDKTEANKAEIGKATNDGTEKEYIDVEVIINTTNLMDSHNDVHLDGIWTKSLKENKARIVHLMEHDLSFDNLVAKGKDIKAFVKTINWRDLGFDYDGKTQALTFKSRVWKWRNERAFDLYKRGEITEHSVGMRYVKMDLAVNNEDYESEYKNWNKYIDKIANKEQAIENGFFWIVSEAKVVEGSAVVLGSNAITPTQSVSEPQKETPKPQLSTSEIKEALEAGLQKILNKN